MNVYEITIEPDKTYFLRTWSSGAYAYDYKLVKSSGKWSTREARYDASDLRNFPDKFRLVCSVSAEVLLKPILRAVVDARYAADNQVKEGSL